MEDHEILLRIRRKLSKSEKYRFLLNYLDAVESQLAEERKKHTELIKENKKLQQQLANSDNHSRLLQNKLDEFRKKESAGNFISAETYKRACKTANEFERKYHQQVKANIELQNRSKP